MQENAAPFPPTVLRLLLHTSNLTEAARACGLLAASKALARAETQSGLALVRRDRRPLSLTVEGQILADHAHRQEQMTQAVCRALEESRAQGCGTVGIASFGASASTHILPGLVAAAG